MRRVIVQESRIGYAEGSELHVSDERAARWIAKGLAREFKSELASSAKAEPKSEPKTEIKSDPKPVAEDEHKVESEKPKPTKGKK